MPLQNLYVPLISAPTGFHNRGLVARWAQLLITSNYYLPNIPKDRSRVPTCLSGGSVFENHQTLGCYISFLLSIVASKTYDSKVKNGFKSLRPVGIG